jgi:hypothetical protein
MEQHSEPYVCTSSSCHRLFGLAATNATHQGHEGEGAREEHGLEEEADELPKAKEAEACPIMPAAPEAEEEKEQLLPVHTVKAISSAALQRSYTVSTADEAFTVRTRPYTLWSRLSDCHALVSLATPSDVRTRGRI